MQHTNATTEKTRKPARAASYDAKSRREAEGQRGRSWNRSDKRAEALS